MIINAVRVNLNTHIQDSEYNVDAQREAGNRQLLLDYG